jgi:predicted enzyme related to lactoylglutathione lyase
MKSSRSPVNRLLVLVAATIIAAACGTTGIDRGAELPLTDQALIGKFVWHDLITDDVAAARRFYGGLFGWTFADTTHPNGGDYVLIAASGRYLGGIVQLDDPEDSEYSRWLGYLSVADVDDAVGRTSAAGGRAVAGPTDLPRIGRAAAVQDPQGAVLGLLRSDVGDPDDSMPPAHGQVVWNELLAADPGSIADYYVSIGEFRAETRARRGGEYTVLWAQGRERAGIMRRPGEDVDPLWLTHFAVADPAAAAARVAELGGSVLLAPSEDLREGSLAVVTDPTGAILALQRWPE